MRPGESDHRGFLIAVGMNQKGYRQVLGVFKRIKEDAESWRSFLCQLKERGLKGVPLIISNNCLGLIEVLSDITVTRLGEQEFQIGCNGLQDLAWLRQHADDTVYVADITPGTCCLGLWGPFSPSSGCFLTWAWTISTRLCSRKHSS